MTAFFILGETTLIKRQNFSVIYRTQTNKPFIKFLVERMNVCSHAIVLTLKNIL